MCVQYKAQCRMKEEIVKESLAKYANYRNKIAHGSVEPLSDKEVAVYRIILPLIYILMLSEIDLSDTEKKKMIGKLFG